MANALLGAERLPVTRAEALSSGSKRYFTGKPCHRGHIAARFTSNCKCVTCQLAQVQQWRNRSRDHISEYNSKAYWSEPEANRARAKAHRLASPDSVAASTRRWRSANTDKCREYGRRRNARAPEMNRARVKRWREQNPEKAKETIRNARARRRGAEGHHTVADIKRIRKAQKDKCAVCRTRLDGGGHVDHIKSLRRGGSNWPRNIQLLCAPCNHEKNARDPIEFMQSRGLLL